MKTTFIIVRHGQSVGNLERIAAGHTDLDLTDLGREQAEKTAKILAARRIDAIYSSDLKRAYDTVLPLAKERGLEVIREEGLREIHLGEWEGLYISEITERFGEDYSNWREHFGIAWATGGETVLSLAARIDKTLREIAVQNEGKVVLIGTHAAAIRAFFGVITETPLSKLAKEVPTPENASYSEVEYENGIFTPISFSKSEHLTQINAKKTN